jgi:hypothetical protein
MHFLKSLFKYSSAYVLVQLLTGIELGVVFGFGIALLHWEPQTVATLAPLGLVLVVLQYPVVVWLLGLIASGRPNEARVVATP